MVQRLVVVLVSFVGLVGIWIGGCQTPEQKVEKLISKLQHKNPKVRQTAVVALTKMGKDAVPVLIQALQDPDVSVRVALPLGQIGTPDAIKAANSAVPTLIQALQDPDVRLNAALALGQIGTPDAIKEAVPALIKALQDRNKWVRANAAEALKQIVRYPL